MDRAPSAIATIVKRELLTTLRSWQSISSLLILLLVLYGITFLALDQAIENAFYVVRAMERIFMVQVALLLFGALTVVPTTAAASFGRERLEGSYDLLLTTLIPPSQVLLGKLAATLIVSLLIAIAILPLTGLVYFFVGVDVYRLYQALLVIPTTALACAALGLWVATRHESMARIVVTTLGMVVLVEWFIPLVLRWYLSRHFMVSLVTPIDLVVDPFLVSWETYGIFSVYQMTVVLLALGGALCHLKGHRWMAPLTRLRQRMFQSHKPVRFAPIPDTVNPITARERLGISLARPRAGRIVFVAIFALYGGALFYLRDVIEEVAFTIVAMYLERLALLAVVPPLVAVCWVRDREIVTWDMLRLTLLRPSEIVRGKVEGAVRHLWPFFGPVYTLNSFVIFMFALYNWGDDDHLWTLVALGETLLFPVHALMVVSAAQVAVTLTRSIPTAVAAAYGCVVASVLAFILASAFFTVDGSSLIPGLIVGHVVLCGVALGIGIGLTTVLVARLWESPVPMGNSHTRSESTERRPPPLPPKV